MGTTGESSSLTVDERQQKLDKVAAEARGYTEPVATLLADIAGPSRAAGLLEFGADADVLVVAFGPFMEAPVSKTGPADWDRMIGLNLTLPAILVSSLLPGMVSRGYGRIILFGGPRSNLNAGYRQIGAYGAAKHGLASLVRSVAQQHCSDNVHCNMICPGYVDTEYYSIARKRQLAEQHPAGRLIRTAEISTLVAHLLHPDSDAINGAIIPVDFGV